MLLHKTLHSSTLRLAILCVLLFGVGILGLFGYVYWQAAEYVKAQSDGAIRRELGALMRVHDAQGASGLARAIGDLVANGSGDGVFLLTDPTGAYVSGNLKTWPEQLSGAAGTAEFRSAAWPTEASKPPLLRASYRLLPDGYRLLVGRDIDDYDRFADAIGTSLAFGVALLVLFAAIAGVSVSRRTVSRIEAVNAMSCAIMEANLSRRIPLRGTHDEWDQLASNLNSMLDRIQELVRGIRQVSDGIAHDLRTPLARFMGAWKERFTARPRSTAIMRWSHRPSATSTSFCGPFPHSSVFHRSNPATATRPSARWICRRPRARSSNSSTPRPRNAVALSSSQEHPASL